MGLQDQVRGASAALSSLASGKRPSTSKRRSLTNQEFEQLRVDLEDILQEFEPTKVGTAADLLKHYDGLEAELVQCYRYYYTKTGEPLELVVDVEKSSLGTNNQDTENLSQSFRKRLSLPKPAIATYLNAKLLAKFQKKQGKPAGSKMEGIRGPEITPPPPQSPKKRSTSFRMLQPKSTLASLVSKVRGSKESNPFEVKSKGHQGGRARAVSAPLSPYQVRCLDTGEALRIDRVNQEILERKTEFTCSKRKNFREKIIIFLQKYDMAAVDDIDSILGYGGKTNEDIWEELQIKYKVNQRTRLLTLFQKYDPERVVDIDILLEEYSNQVEEMISYYKSKYAEQRYADQIRNDPCTWSPGQSNSYQLLPGGQ